MKTVCLPIFILLFFGCSNTVKKDTVQKNPVQQEEVEEFRLVANSNTVHFEYDPHLQNTIDNEKNEDFLFSKKLLFSLDTSLTSLKYNITISDESVGSIKKDTFNITVYDFILTKKNSLIKKAFTNSDVIEKRISTYEMPVSCVSFLNNDNLCSVCKRGLSIDTTLKSKKFINYIKNNSANRLKQQ
ncbi:MAG: hypothetical protein V4608_00495 [Bacteroidota bacterium]